MQTARVDLPHDGDFELALGLGRQPAGAVSAARGSLKERFHDLSHAYDRSWHRYDDDLIAPRRPQRRLARAAGARSSTSTTSAPTT